MSIYYQHLGIFSDWVEAAQRQGALFPLAAPGTETQQKVREALGFSGGLEQPLDVQIEARWELDGLAGEEISWSVGYGPRTRAYLLKPAKMDKPLPALLALHDHGAYKFYGKEKIADGPQGPSRGVQAMRNRAYGGRAFANALAQEGFVVLVHDVFLWGSRGFPLETMLEMVAEETAAMLNYLPPSPDDPLDIFEYNQAASFHEHWVAKYCNILGTSLAGVVSHEDRIAYNYLLSRPEVNPEAAGCLGLSGGGNRAAMLNATHDGVRAAAISGLMTTYEGLLDHNMSHTWMLFPYGWSRHGDWPDLAACRAPSPLLVQYLLDDLLFTEQGMRAADTRLKHLFTLSGSPQAYTGLFYPGPHRFDLEMQRVAFAWLKSQLRI